MRLLKRISKFFRNRSLKEGFAALPSETVGLDTPVDDFGFLLSEFLGVTSFFPEDKK